MEICIDDSNFVDGLWDFEGFIFHFPDGSSKEISRIGACSTDRKDWKPRTLNMERLIGFSVQISPPIWGSYETIRKIKPIFDSPDCSDTTFDLSAIPSTFSIDIGEGEKSLTLEVPDSISSRYGAMDGSSFIGARMFTLTDVPEWVRVEGNQLIISSTSMFDFTETLIGLSLAAKVSVQIE